MGGLDKLLQDVDGQPLLRLVAQRALAASTRVAVGLRPDDAARRAVLKGLGVTVLSVPDAASGMAASLRAGAGWAKGAAALMIALPDMPDITAEDMRGLIAAQAEDPDSPLRASTQDGTPGHPVILPRPMLACLSRLRGDEGARALLRASPPRLLALAGQRALTDLDTPADWVAWRAGRSPVHKP